MSGSTTAGDLAETLLAFVEEHLAHLAAGPLPELHLPGLLMGQPVGQDVRADLAFTLGLLHSCGRSQVAGIPIPDAIAQLLQGVEGEQIHTFFSYRVAETVARFGPFDSANPVLAGLDDDARQQVAEATDSTGWIELLDGGALPRNYAAVLARCEHARSQLGLPVDQGGLDHLVDRTRALLGGHMDDSNTGVGRYDIYTVDIHLFCEPLADLIGEPWRTGAMAALALVERTATRDGAALPWGRSTGALACCHTIELAGLVARRGLGEDPARWGSRAAGAAAHLDGWFDRGWVTAHQHRSSDPYRGLDRRLQMTLDCLGKLVDAAEGLRRQPGLALDVAVDDLFPAVDEVVWFDEPLARGVWAFRNEELAFSLPFVGGTTTDYLPAPRHPGLFEVPVGSPLGTGTPLLLHDGKQFVAGGAPISVVHQPRSVRARYAGFPRAGQLEPGPRTPVLGGTRDVTWRVEGRTLVVEEHLELDDVPEALAVQVTEAEDRPLRFAVECEAPHRTATVDVDGIAEYRSPWGELPRVHQVDIEPARSVHLRWSVTPVLRVASTAHGHLYSDSLYAPLDGRVRVERVPQSTAWRANARADFARRIDQLHLHWPEWLPGLGADLGAHAGFIDGVQAEGTRIVWTMHNLVPHTKDPAFGAVYQRWAEAADLVIHHSAWARDLAMATYAYGESTRHVVIPHAHWGSEPGPSDGRAGVEAELGLRSAALRLGIVGAPRAEKNVELAMRAMARSQRHDIELLVLSLDGGDDVPDDPRIVGRPYEMVARPAYARRLLALDALLMPFDPDGQMLATGTVGDAVAAGLPTIASSWPYLAEALGGAAIVYGRTEDDLVACLDGLSHDALAAAAAAARALQPGLDWGLIAERTYVELDRLGSAHH